MGPSESNKDGHNWCLLQSFLSWLFTFRNTFPKFDDFNDFGPNLSCSFAIFALSHLKALRPATLS